MRIKKCQKEEWAGELGRSGLQERNPSTQAGKQAQAGASGLRGWALGEACPSQSPVKRAILNRQDTNLNRSGGSQTNLLTSISHALLLAIQNCTRRFMYPQNSESGAER